MFLGLGMCVRGFECFASLFYGISVEVVPRILSDSTYALLCMVGLIMACWDGWSIADGLLDMYFLCDVLWGL